MKFYWNYWDCHLRTYLPSHWGDNDTYLQLFNSKPEEIHALPLDLPTISKPYIGQCYNQRIYSHHYYRTYYSFTTGPKNYHRPYLSWLPSYNRMYLPKVIMGTYIQSSSNTGLAIIAKLFGSTLLLTNLSGTYLP